MGNLRHENKYDCNNIEFAEIKNNILPILKIDKNAINGGYNIRSLYFDDYVNSGYYQVENGLGNKKKWRIRIYNCDDSRISLEKKMKFNEMTYKESTLIDRNTFNLMLKNSMDFKNCKDNLLLEFISETESKLLKPACIVDYYRTPFICEDGNVRITFDEQIGYSQDFENFFEKDLGINPVLFNESSLLEVKYDDFLPDYIANIFRKYNMKKESFSKYYLCRRTLDK